MVISQERHMFPWCQQALWWSSRRHGRLQKTPLSWHIEAYCVLCTKIPWLQFIGSPMLTEQLGVTSTEKRNVSEWWFYPLFTARSHLLLWIHCLIQISYHTPLVNRCFKALLLLNLAQTTSRYLLVIMSEGLAMVKFPELAEDGLIVVIQNMSSGLLDHEKLLETSWKSFFASIELINIYLIFCSIFSKWKVGGWDAQTTPKIHAPKLRRFRDEFDEFAGP